MVTARVVLRGADSYTVNKRTWVKDIPQIVKGEETVQQFEANGYFVVKRLSTQKVEAKQNEPEEPLKRGFVKRSLPEKLLEEEVTKKGED